MRSRDVIFHKRAVSIIIEIHNLYFISMFSSIFLSNDICVLLICDAVTVVMSMLDNVDENTPEGTVVVGLSLHLYFICI